MKYLLAIRSNQCCADVSLSIELDGQHIAKFRADGMEHEVTGWIDENDSEHALTALMAGKTAEHTLLDEDDVIVEDVFFEISRLEFEDLDMIPILCQGLACYSHDFNQSGQLFTDEFYGRMGCNGSATMRFRTPFYLWLNDHF